MGCVGAKQTVVVKKGGKEDHKDPELSKAEVSQENHKQNEQTGTPPTTSDPTPASTTPPKTSPTNQKSDRVSTSLATSQTPDKQKVGKDDFELLSVVGRGSVGKVMMVKKKDDGQIYAMKILRKQAIVDKDREHIMQERSLMAKMRHPFVVGLHYAFQTGDSLYMIMDYVNGGELFFLLKNESKFAVERARFYAAEIASALMHLHSLGVVFRDLKPENVLIRADGHACLTDFGLAKNIGQSGRTYTLCGTAEYMAPEILLGKGHGLAVDWWALGIMLYEMIAGGPPFYSNNADTMYNMILNNPVRFPSFMPSEAIGIIQAFLIKDPETRLGSGENGHQKIKEHPFWNGLDWDKLYRKEITPPWLPPVEGSDDTKMIDPDFTSQQVTDSVVESTLSNTYIARNKIENFTFMEESALQNAADPK